MAGTEEIKYAAEIIKNGGLVSFPTETVYGLGADAFNSKAVSKIFEVKKRPTFNPLIIHIYQITDLQRLFASINKHLITLVEQFWPGPLTIVMEKHPQVPHIVTSGLSTVAVRMPANEIALKLIKESGTLIAAPSANKFGMLSPTTARHVSKQLPNIDCILDGGRTTYGIESTVIFLNNKGFKLLRSGAISAEELQEVVPALKDDNKPQRLISPGMLKSHYSPVKPIFVEGESTVQTSGKKIGYMSFGSPSTEKSYWKTEILSRKKDLREAAANLFDAMHRLEESDVDYIIVEPVPEKGIGIAIMDRLRKASYRYKSE